MCVISRDAEGAGAGCRPGNLTALLLHVDPAGKKHVSITCVLVHVHESKQRVDQVVKQLLLVKNYFKSKHLPIHTLTCPAVPPLESWDWTAAPVLAGSHRSSSAH